MSSSSDSSSSEFSSSSSSSSSDSDSDQLFSDPPKNTSAAKSKKRTRPSRDSRASKGPRTPRVPIDLPLTLAKALSAIDSNDTELATLLAIYSDPHDRTFLITAMLPRRILRQQSRLSRHQFFQLIVDHILVDRSKLHPSLNSIFADHGSGPFNGWSTRAVRPSDPSIHAHTLLQLHDVDRRDFRNFFSPDQVSTLFSLLPADLRKSNHASRPRRNPSSPIVGLDPTPDPHKEDDAPRSSRPTTRLEKKPRKSRKPKSRYFGLRPEHIERVQINLADDDQPDLHPVVVDDDEVVVLEKNLADAQDGKDDPVGARLTADALHCFRALWNHNLAQAQAQAQEDARRSTLALFHQSFPPALP